MGSDERDHELVPLAGPTRRRAYLVGPSGGTTAERAARFAPAHDALAAAGYDVISPGFSHPDAIDADHLLSVVNDDYDALASADVVVTLPGSDALWECAIADALGVPRVPFGQHHRLRSA